jgi:hypothetical protein
MSSNNKYPMFKLLIGIIEIYLIIKFKSSLIFIMFINNVWSISKKILSKRINNNKIIKFTDLYSKN